MNNQSSINTSLSVEFLYTVYLPYDTKRTELYIFTWISQFMADIFLQTVYSGCDTLLVMMILHLSGQLVLVGISLRNLVNESNEKTYKAYCRNLADIIERHQRINE